jgi:histidinol-phosphate aminotransferase
MAYLEDGDEVVTSRSSFPMYDIYTLAMRARMVKTPLTADYGIDLDAMAGAITERTKMVYVCNPNNPTGMIVDADAVDAFVQRVPERVIVVLDEAYVEMVDSDAFPDSIAYVREGRRNVFVMRTFSKVYGLAGIRIGYGFAHPDVVSTLFKIKPPFNVNVLAQAAGIAALSDVEFVARSVTANKAGRQYLVREFDRLGLDHAESHTNFVLVHIGPNALAVQQALLQQGVIVRPCAGYDLPEFLRVSIGTPEQNERFITTLQKTLHS